MRFKELYQVLKGIGFPVAYHHFEEGHCPSPPFLVYLATGSENFGADNWSYHKNISVQIELYTAKKDLLSEEMVESVLDTHRLHFDKIETYVTSEKLYQINYYITLNGG